MFSTLIIYYSNVPPLSKLVPYTWHKPEIVENPLKFFEEAKK